MNEMIKSLATRLDEAIRTGTAIPQLTGDQGADVSLDLESAYAVQRAGISLRTERGERVVGAKLGFTSRAKAEQMGVSDVIIGVLTDAMAVQDGGVLDISRGVHPRVEPEVAFRLSRTVDLTDPHADVLGAVDAVAPALEVIDSRYRDFRFSLADVVADNTSASGFVVGPWTSLVSTPHLDLTDRSVELIIDGATTATGSTADILGDPWAALPAIQRMAGRYGQELLEGSVILAGAATAAVALRPGSSVTASIESLGSVTLEIQELSRG